ncbi:hypothetical protein GsuE55_34280 [Geobacillus subterraneus]|uniref:Uncharacterized protein n=1 Tax=Geobacillus subterraneus TaxID=129338 RepID=A0A679FV88_9BACL|nr:hypothetical protein GsuE55_34280 [Geobacillus subterraneus]
MKVPYISSSTKIVKIAYIESKWSGNYPRKVQSWANELGILLTFMDDSSCIRNVIDTTNTIE